MPEEIKQEGLFEIETPPVREDEHEEAVVKIPRWMEPEIPGVILREEKGSALTFTELDDNFRYCATYAYPRHVFDERLDSLKTGILEMIFYSQIDAERDIQAHLFVGPDGSDGNTGIDGAHRLFTLQGAFNRLQKFFLPVSPFRISLSEGYAFKGATLKRSVSPFIIIQCDKSLPTNAVITGTINQPAISLENVELEAVGMCFTGDYMIHVGHNAKITFRHCVFDGHFEYGIVADSGTVVLGEGNIIRNAANSGIFMYAKHMGLIKLEQQLLVQGINQIQTFALCEHNSEIRVDAKIAGASVIGQKFIVRMNSLISTAGSGLNVFPGNEEGFIDTETGGIYE